MVTTALMIYRSIHQFRCLVDSDEYCSKCDDSMPKFFWPGWIADAVTLAIAIATICERINKWWS